MPGTTITLKNVPPELHRSLKERAKEHKRSLNQEAIHVLETSLLGDRGRSSSLRQPPPLRSLGKLLVSPETLVARADDLLERGR